MSDDLDLRDGEEREDGDGPITLSDDSAEEETGEEVVGEDGVESLDALRDEEEDEDGFDEFERDDITDY